MSQETPNEKQGRILVVDDNPANLRLLTDLLTESGYQVHPASSGKLALRFIQSTPPDLILLDILMPGMDGYQVCWQLKADERTREIPVIFMTALSETQNKVTGFKLGAVDYITKPFQVEEVLARIHAHLALRTLQKRLEEQNRQLRQEIAERQQAQEALRRSEEKYRSLVENLNDVPFALDTQGRFTYISPAIERLANYPAQEILGQDFTRFVHPDDLPELQVKFVETLGGSLSSHDFRVFAKDGAVLHVRTSSRPLWESGQLVGLNGIIMDITARKQAEEALHKAHADLERRVEARTAELARINRMLNILSECNQTVMRATEEPALLQEICHILINLGGYPLTWIGFAEPDAACTVRPVAQAGFEDGYLNHLNMTWADTGPSQELAGRAILSGEPCVTHNIHTDPQMASCRQEAIRLGYASSIALPLWGDERVFGVLNIYAALPDAFHTEEVRLLTELAGDLAFGISSLRQREARRQAEEEREKLQAQLIQAQKLELLGRLAGGLAHDFNNILAVVLGHTELTLMKMAPSDPLRAGLQEIEKAACRSADLTRQLLAFARNQTIAPVVLNLNDTVSAMLSILKRLIGEDIELVWRPEAQLWPVKMDPSQIDQLLTNLCVNARDAISGVGKIIIETANIAFDEAYCASQAGFSAGEYILISVSDNGCGMDEEIQAHLFEPFFTTKGIGRGTGLGLSTVYGIVKQNEGFIKVTSEAGKGSTFKIYLPRPVERTIEAARRVAEAKRVAFGRETVLLVEDQSEILTLCQAILENLGYRVLSAGTPGTAVQMAEKQPEGIQLLITDVVMPEMNGPDLARRLRAIYPNLRCLFMSGYTADIIAHKGILDKGVHFIQKPFSVKELASKVRQALDQKKGG